MRALTALFVFAISLSASEYTAAIEKWRQDRETRLKAPDNWLSVAGLIWLKQGANPVHGGVTTLQGDQVTFRPAGGQSTALKPNSDQFVTAEGVKLSVIRRGDRLGLRVRDNKSVYRTKFTRLEWYPVDPTWRIQATYTPFAQKRKTHFDSMTGDKQQMIIPGVVEFIRNGERFRLSPVLEGDELFFVFRDKTAGKTTYPAARFLYAKAPGKAGPVELDFNKAYNPPCAFTPYATCPLPPKENRLTIPVEAGEKKYRGPH
jgi:uncharacterized protein (DUF1684 family)